MAAARAARRAALKPYRKSAQRGPQAGTSKQGPAKQGAPGKRTTQTAPIPTVDYVEPDLLQRPGPSGYPACGR